MENSGKENTNSSVGLNENPKIPDVSGVASALGSNAAAAPTVTIGNFVVNGGGNGKSEESLEEQIDKARRDTSMG